MTVWLIEVIVGGIEEPDADRLQEGIMDFLTDFDLTLEPIRTSRSELPTVEAIEKNL